MGRDVKFLTNNMPARTINPSLSISKAGKTFHFKKIVTWITSQFRMIFLVTLIYFTLGSFLRYWLRKRAWIVGLAEEAGRTTIFPTHIFLLQVNKLALPIFRDKDNIKFSKPVPLFQIILLRELVGLISFEY